MCADLPQLRVAPERVARLSRSVGVWACAPDHPAEGFVLTPAGKVYDP
jgi:hypothetical protein